MLRNEGVREILGCCASSRLCQLSVDVAQAVGCHSPTSCAWASTLVLCQQSVARVVPTSDFANQSRLSSSDRGVLLKV